MPSQNYEIITGIVIATIIFMLAGFFILILIVYSNKRKKKFIKEKQLLEIEFNQQLLQSQLEIQEQTFNTISREIHDNVGQVLSLTKVQLNIIDQTQILDNTLLSDAKEGVRKALTDLRDIAKSLNSERIQFLSLPEITEHELQRINRSGLMDYSVQVEGGEQSMQEQKKLITFRIIQEALQNIIKHSKAKSIDVFFCYDMNCLKVEITDNGIGFDPQLLSKKDGLGLHNILNRASLIGGEAKIESKPNEGTTITIISPYV